MSPGTATEPTPVHVISPTAHHLSRQYQLTGGLCHELRRRDHLDLTTGHRLRGHDTVDTAKMVDVTVGKDDGSHRSLVQMLSGKVQGAAGGLNGGQRVDHNPAPLAGDQAHIGQIKAPQLVNPRAHLKQAGAVVQTLLAPEAGIHRIRSITGDKIVAGAIPGQGVIKPRHLQLLC